MYYKTTVTSLILLTLFSITSLAQDFPWRQLSGSGHTKAVSSVAFSPDGNILASGGLDKIIHLWNARTGEHLRILSLNGHTEAVSSVAFSPDSGTLASGSSDETVRLWDAHTGALLRTLEGHTDSVNSVAFSPDGSMLASGSGDNSVHLWNARTGELLQTLEGHTDSVNSVAFSPDGSMLASGSGDNSVRLWNARTGELLQMLEEHTDSVNSIAFNRVDNTLASGSGDNSVRLWNTLTGELLQTLDGHTDLVSSVVFSPEGGTLASGSSDETVRLWDANSGELRRALEKHTDSVSSVAFSPEGDTFACGSRDAAIRLWDARSGERLRTLARREAHTKEVTSLAFSPDGSMFASGSADTTIRLYETHTGAYLRTLRGHTNRVDSVAFSADSNTLVSWGRDETIRLWDAHTGELLRTLTLEEHALAALSPDGSIFASTSLGDNTIRLSDAHTGELLQTLEGHTNRVDSVAFSADSNTLASSSWDATIRLWDAHTGELLRTLEMRAIYDVFALSTVGNRLAGRIGGRVSVLDAQTGERQLQLALEDHYWRALSPDGNTLVSWSTRDDTIRLWDAHSGELLRTLEGDRFYVSSVAFSPDSNTLATGTWLSGNNVRLWDVHTGEERLQTLKEEQTNPALSVAFSPADGNMLASVSADTVRLWDAHTGEHLRTLEGHTGRVLSVAFSPDGNTLASGSDDGTMRLWDAHTGEFLRTVEDEYDEDLRENERISLYGINSVAFSPDGNTLVRIQTVSRQGERAESISLWDAHTGERQRMGRLEESRSTAGGVALSPGGNTIAVGLRKAAWEGGATIHVLSRYTGSRLLTLGKDLEGRYYRVAFSPDGNTLASAIADGIRLFNVRTGARLATLNVRTGARLAASIWRPVSDIAFHPNGGAIATVSEYGIDLWHVATGFHRAALEGSFSSVAFSPDGNTLAAGAADDRVILWKYTPSSNENASVSVSPSQVESPVIGEQITFSLAIANGENVGGYQATIQFDSDTLRYVDCANGDFLAANAFFVPPIVSGSQITVGATSFAGSANGDGALATFTFEVVEVRNSQVVVNELILTDANGEPLPFGSRYGNTIIEPSAVPTSAIVRVTPSTVLSPSIGEQFSLNVDIAGGQDIEEHNLSLEYDESALRLLSSNNQGYGGDGDGTLLTATFQVVAVKTSTVSVSGLLRSRKGLDLIPTFESATVSAPLLGDVNRDGAVNILDLVLVSSSFGKPVPKDGDPADVNEDGVVNVIDLVKVAGAMANAAAPSARDIGNVLTRDEVEGWLADARRLALTDAASQRGILFLESLMAALTPKDTALLPNYPNPFNPETWIPYRLAEDADVQITIYGATGGVVRRIALGHRPAGFYTAKSRAVYWDGRNQANEPVGSGIYFYRIQAGDYSQVRRLAIIK